MASQFQELKNGRSRFRCCHSVRREKAAQGVDRGGTEAANAAIGSGRESQNQGRQGPLPANRQGNVGACPGGSAAVADSGGKCGRQLRARDEKGPGRYQGGGSQAGQKGSQKESMTD